jgi:hypothetical protein
MFMQFRFCATLAFGGLLFALPPRARATTAADLCPAGTGPCVVSRSVRVDDNSVIDTGTRHLVIAAGGVLIVDSGTMTLQADRLTIEDGGFLRALGTASEAGGTIHATANVIAVVGQVEVAGAPGGEVTLTSTGELTVTGAIDANARSRDEDGGAIMLQGATITLAGPVTANGGRDGLGGDVDVNSAGDLLVSRNVEASGGDGGSVDLVAGASGTGNLTVSQTGRVQADALTEDGFGESVSLSASGDGIANGHIIMHGLITVSGIAGGNAGAIDIDAAGDVRGTDTTAHIIASGGRPNGAGGEISITSTLGQYTCVATIEVRGNSAAPGGSLDLDFGGGIILATPIDARGGTVGGSILARASGDVTVETTLRSDGGVDDGGARIDLEGCTVVINPNAVLSSQGPNGINRLTGHDLTVVRGTMLANERNGLNEIVYGEARRRPVIFDSAQVVPNAVQTEDSRLAPCMPLVTLTPSRTPTSTRGPRTSTPSPTATLSICVGDCDGDKKVVVNELVLGVNVALLRQPLNTCRAFDPNDSGSVSVDELVRGVNSALHGCP